MDGVDFDTAVIGSDADNAFARQRRTAAGNVDGYAQASAHQWRRVV